MTSRDILLCIWQYENEIERPFSERITYTDEQDGNKIKFKYADIITPETVVYFDKEKAETLERLSGIQFPGVYSDLDSKTILHCPKCVVNVNSDLARELEQTLAARPFKDQYMLLGRLRSDCEYWISGGSHADKHLWAGSVPEQITKMRELYELLPVKPEWITPEDIDRYEAQMSREAPENYLRNAELYEAGKGGGYDHIDGLINSESDGELSTEKEPPRASAAEKPPEKESVLAKLAQKQKLVDAYKQQRGLDRGTRKSRSNDLSL